MARTEEPISVLYVCPRAHRAGHAPLAAVRESAALARAGARVCLLTFQGILDGAAPPNIPQRTVVPGWARFPLRVASRFLDAMPKGSYVVCFLEQAATTVAGARLSRSSGYDVIYLRDADPFVFIPFVLSLFSRGRRWALSLAGTVGKGLYGSLPNRLIASPVIWGRVYRRAVSRSRFVLLCESEYVRQYFEEEFMRAMFSGKVAVLPPKAEQAATHVSKKEARRRLGLPDDGFVLLHFGTLHPGKDVETVVTGVKDLPGVFLVHAGEVAGGGDPGRLVELHGISARAAVIDRYVPEDEKRLFFRAADAIALSYRADFMQAVSMLWQAARFGVPAIASDVGELGEAVKRYGVGLVFEAEDHWSFADSLSRFMALGDDAREAMARNCEKLCDEFPTDDWTRRLVGVLEGLCAEESAGV